VDWYDATGQYHEKTFPHDGRLASLPEEWQRELAAIWRLETDVNNGGYLQFLANWGRESYVYAIQCLKRIGATTMAKLIDDCQALIDEHYDTAGKSQADLQQLMPNEMIDIEGNVIKERGSVLPDNVIDRIMDLSYEFMDYPENIASLGLAHFRHHLEN
jgi:hypothetical protein